MSTPLPAVRRPTTTALTTHTPWVPGDAAVDVVWRGRRARASVSALESVLAPHTHKKRVWREVLGIFGWSGALVLLPALMPTALGMVGAAGALCAAGGAVLWARHRTRPRWRMHMWPGAVAGTWHAQFKADTPGAVAQSAALMATQPFATRHGVALLPFVQRVVSCTPVPGGFEATVQVPDPPSFLTRASSDHEATEGPLVWVLAMHGVTRRRTETVLWNAGATLEGAMQPGTQGTPCPMCGAAFDGQRCTTCRARFVPATQAGPWLERAFGLTKAGRGPRDVAPTATCTHCGQRMAVRTVLDADIHDCPGCGSVLLPHAACMALGADVLGQLA